MPVPVPDGAPEHLQAPVAAAVPHLPAGDMAVADVNDGVGILLRQVMEDNLAVGSELPLQHVQQLAEKGQVLLYIFQARAS